ncbi:MAG: hypothetical protein ACXV3F_15505 [Frankiaceae bacterium]
MPPAGPDDADPLGVTLLHVLVIGVAIGLLVRFAGRPSNFAVPAACP